MLYDDNWISYSMYVVCTVESGCNYGAIESNGVGIGIAQWSNARSYTLLQKLVTDYPNILSLLPSLEGEIGTSSSSWSSKIFYQTQRNEISAALVTDEGVATQNALYYQDCKDSYIPVLRDRCFLSDPKGTIFALSIYHQSPQAFWQVYNAVGNQGMEVWYNCALNNGIVGKYKNRQDTVLRLLNEWDGQSGKEGFGVKNAENEIGGNNNPNAGNPDFTYSVTDSTFSTSSIQKVGTELWLKLKTEEGFKTVQFYMASDNNIWYAKNGESNAVGETVTIPVPTLPEVSGTTSEQEQVVNYFMMYEGTLKYSQSAELRQNPPNGYSDCSGLYWWAYNKIGVEVGTWTGQQGRNGVKIYGGSGSVDESILKLGDAILIMRNHYNSDFDHVEMYIGNGQCAGHGGSPPLGPTRKNLQTYLSDKYYFEIRRYINVN